MSAAAVTTEMSSTVTVLVAGMHRTGTSAIAGALLASGFQAGSIADFQLTTAENPRGYGELRRVMDFNDLLLSMLGWTWDSPAPEPLADYPVLDRFVDDGRRLVDELLGTEPSARLIKDPRVSLLLPTWRKVLLDRAVAVVTLRPPDEVAWSLYVRNSLHLALGHALWNAYHRHLAKGLEGLPVIFVDYAKLVADPAGTTNILVEELERLTGAGPIDRQVAAAAVDPSLRRASVPGTAWSPSDTAAADLVLRSWCPQAATAHDRFASEALAGPQPWEEAILDVHRLGRRRELDVRRLGASSADVQRVQRREQLPGRTRGEQTSERDELEAAVDVAGARIDELQRALDSARLEADGAQQELQAARTELDKLVQVRSRLTSEVADLQRGLEVYRNSTSWRVTAPLRSMGALVRAVIRRPTS